MKSRIIPKRAPEAADQVQYWFMDNEYPWKFFCLGGQ